MFCLNVSQRNRLRTAINACVNREIIVQVVNGYLFFIAIGALVGFWLGSIYYGIVVGFLLHSLFLILGNDRIEQIASERTEYGVSNFLQQVRKAPKLIQDEYIKKIATLSDNQMIRWASQGFCVEISGTDILKSINEP